MIESLQGGYQTQAISYTARGAAKQDAAQPVSSGDTVSLSGGGRLMSTFFAGLGIKPSSNGAVYLDDLEAAREQKQQSVEGDIDALLRRNGIATSPPVTLTSDEEGNVRVQGGHPQKAKIEGLFADNPELSNNFRAVSGLSSLVDAGKEYSDFAALYDKDPYTALSQYGHLFNGFGDEEFTLTVGGSPAASDAASPGTAGKTPAADQAVPKAPRPDFTNATRQELLDWANSEIVSGRMSLEDGFPFMGMTMAIPVDGGQEVNMATDSRRYDFTAKARDGIAGALSRGDRQNAEMLRKALDLMGVS